MRARKAGRPSRTAFLPFALLAVALAFASGAGAERQTTAPGALLTVYVTLSDRGIAYSMWHTVSPEGNTQMEVASRFARGEVAIFQIRNNGKKRHDFEAFGKKTPALKPGATGHFRVALLHRGNFAYESTIDKHNKAFRGVFTVH